METKQGKILNELAYIFKSLNNYFHTQNNIFHAAVNVNIVHIHVEGCLQAILCNSSTEKSIANRL